MGEFDYSTVKTAVAAVFGTTRDISKGIQSMFVTRIAKEGKVVVERKKLNQMMNEQNLAASNRVKAGTGAKIGQILAPTRSCMATSSPSGGTTRRRAWQQAASWACDRCDRRSQQYG